MTSLLPTQLSQIGLPLTVGVIVYVFLIYMIILTSRRFQNADTQYNSMGSRILFGLGLSFIISLLITPTPNYLKDEIIPSLYFSYLILLLPAFFFAILAWLPNQPKPPWSIECRNFYQEKLGLSPYFVKLVDSPWRKLGLPNIGCLKLDSLLAPINSCRSLVSWFILLVVMPYSVRMWILLLLQGTAPVDPEIGTLIPSLIKSGLYVSIVEEAFFKWTPLVLWGSRGLTLGVLFWFIWHPVQLIMYGAEAGVTVLTTIVWALGIPFYIKSWRGKYIWAPFVVHSVTNISLILLRDLFGIPA